MRLEGWVLASAAFLLAGSAPAEPRQKKAAPPAASAQKAHRGQLGADAQDALQKTQAMLRSPAARGEVIRGDAGAGAAHARVEKLTRSAQHQQRIYDIAADVLSDVAARGQGDPAQMSKIMEAARQDPAAFLQGLSAEQQAAIHRLAEELVKQNPELGGLQAN